MKNHISPVFDKVEEVRAYERGYQAGMEEDRPAAFQAVYADFKLIKTRGMTQFIFEVPIEHSDAAYQVLGGMPVQGESVWVAIARIKHGEPS